MTLGQLLLLHLMAGAGVAVAVYLTAPPGRPAERWFQVASAVVFWPFYLPLLLAPRDEAKPAPADATAMPPDELAGAIAQVDAELEGALRSLDGWAEGVLAREKDRLHELRTAWSAQAQRVRDMDRLLARPEYAEPAADEAVTSERLRNSQQVIRQNVQRLRLVRERTLQDLLETLAWVRELVSMIHLAKFTGAPASRAEELVARIAAAVEGVSALTWQDDPARDAPPAAVDPGPRLQVVAPPDPGQATENRQAEGA
jgi:hypothetical protein